MSHPALLNVMKFLKMKIMKAAYFCTPVGEYCMENLCCHVFVISSNDNWNHFLLILYSPSDYKVISSCISPLGCNGAIHFFTGPSFRLSFHSCVRPYRFEFHVITPVCRGFYSTLLRTQNRSSSTLVIILFMVINDLDI